MRCEDRTMRNFVLSNYDAFYTMLVSTLIMTNEHSREWYAHQNQIIHFIGSAYNFDSDKIQKCKDIISSLSELSLKSETFAFFGRQRGETELSEKEFFLNIKCEALCAMEKLEKSKNILAEWFDYSHYQAYIPQKRFFIMQNVGSTGEMITARQTAILLALGIGTERNFEEAEYRFLQCMYWGDIPSSHMLAEVYRLQGKEQEYQEALEVVTLLERYLTSGRINLPLSVKANYSTKAIQTYCCISAIKNEVINALEISHIDYSFVEILLSDECTYEQKMNYINFYNRFDWKRFHPDTPRSKVGF